MKPSVTILFATVTGNAEGCAIDLARHLEQRGFSCRSENLANYAATSLAGEAVALFVVSTWGEGEPPDDAIPFFDDLGRLESCSLAGLCYAVFALGDSSYDVFCGFGKACDLALNAAGAARLHPCEECDLDHEEKLPHWARSISEALETRPLEAALE